jgi:pyruvate dehydrogenase E1 component alpha subunit
VVTPLAASRGAPALAVCGARDALLDVAGNAEDGEVHRDEEAADHAADVRRRALEITSPDRSVIFDNVYAEPHPLMTDQKAWLDAYETSFDGSDS